jgi:hypothetical protein
LRQKKWQVCLLDATSVATGDTSRRRVAGRKQGTIMNGGYFYYAQNDIPVIAETIEARIDKAGNGEKDERGVIKYPVMQPAVLEALKRAADALRIAYVYAHRVDWLFSGDDGDDAFLQRLKGELDSLHLYAATDPVTNAKETS